MIRRLHVCRGLRLAAVVAIAAWTCPTTTTHAAPPGGRRGSPYPGSGGIRSLGHGFGRGNAGVSRATRLGGGFSRSSRALSGRRLGGFGLGSRRSGGSISARFGRGRSGISGAFNRRGRNSSFRAGFNLGFGGNYSRYSSYPPPDYYYSSSGGVTLYYPGSYRSYSYASPLIYADPIGYDTGFLIDDYADLIAVPDDRTPKANVDPLSLDAPLPVGPAARPAAPTARNAERAREMGIALGRGDKAFETGDYDDAREEYVRAVVLAGDDPRARIALALAEFARGQYGDAATALGAGLARLPQLPSTSFDLARAYGDATDLEAHRASLENHVKAHPDDADAWLVAGFVRYFSGDRPGGIEAFDRYRSLSNDATALDEFIAKAKAR